MDPAIRNPVQGWPRYMYVTHPTCVPPSDPGVKLWRYLDLAKFLDVLEFQRLHFSRLDQLRDPFEGYWTKPVVDRYPDVLVHSEEPDPKAYLARVIRSTPNLNRHWAFVNCWNIAQNESLAMWEAYSDKGLAIQTTYLRLCKSFGADRDNEVFVGKVSYLDYDADDMAEDNSLQPVLCKRKMFQFEQELRAFTLHKWDVPQGGLSIEEAFGPNLPKGKYISIDPSVLIARVYVSPGRPAWFRDLVIAVLSRHGLKGIPVEPSEFDRHPDYEQEKAG